MYKVLSRMMLLKAPRMNPAYLSIISGTTHWKIFSMIFPTANVTIHTMTKNTASCTRLLARAYATHDPTISAMIDIA